MFRKLKGMSPSEWLTHARMEKAKTLLAQANGPILDIARKVGFPDPYHFSRRFKQTVGVAPSHYAERPSPKIVAFDCLGHCLALGIAPFAANSSYAEFTQGDGTNETPNRIVTAELHTVMEQLRALRPDLIISPQKEWHRSFSDVAPVLEFNLLDDPIYEQLPRIAAHLGKEREAAEWLGRYEARSKLLRQQVQASIGRERVAVLRVREGLLQMYGMLTVGYPLYRSLQAAQPERIAMQSWCNAKFHSSVITLDELPYYEAEHLFVILGTAADKRLWQRLSGSEVCRSFPAVRAGNVYPLDARQWLAFDPLSISRQMEEAAQMLTGQGKRHEYPSGMQ
jgi:ABC-type Fe3+-hydroxamate transport system substrate-binding protein